MQQAIVPSVSSGLCHRVGNTGRGAPFSSREKKQGMYSLLRVCRH